jgi:hypothetical protein
MPNYTAFVTLLAVLFYAATGFGVARARRKFGIVAPTTSGQPDFDRAFSGANEYARMDADFSTAALVVCFLCERYRRGGVGAGLDWRAHTLHGALYGGRR